jgi:hypothetical protein
LVLERGIRQPISWSGLFVVLGNTSGLDQPDTSNRFV